MIKHLKTLAAHCLILIVHSSILLILNPRKTGRLKFFIVQTMKGREKECWWIKMYFDFFLTCNHGNDSSICQSRKPLIIHFQYRKFYDLTKIVILDRRFWVQMSSALSLIKNDSNFYLKTKLGISNLRLQKQTYFSKEIQIQLT